MSLLITNCTNRKRKPVAPGLNASALPHGQIDEIAGIWAEHLWEATSRFPASEVYGGRGFREAANAAKFLEDRLIIVSAGLGLVDAVTEVPAYSCTVLAGAIDAIMPHLPTGAATSEWWNALNKKSRFSLPLRQAIQNSTDLVLAALSDAYLAMLTPDLQGLPQAERDRLRIFTRTPLERVAPLLRAYVMPYDDRLDGPDSSLRGTRSDFAPRALRHFVEHVHMGRPGSLLDDRGAVEVALSNWRMAARFGRERHDDVAVRGLIREHWISAGGSGTRLLRIFRDELNIACEQGRFAALVRDVREAMSLARGKR